MYEDYTNDVFVTAATTPSSAQAALDRLKKMGNPLQAYPQRRWSSAYSIFFFPPEDRRPREPGLWFKPVWSLDLASTKWIPSREIYDPSNLYAVLNTGYGDAQIRSIPTNACIEFEMFFERVGSIGWLADEGFTWRDNPWGQEFLYLVRFRSTDTLEQFNSSAWSVPLHLIVPQPWAIVDHVYDDSEEAQLWGWRQRFEGIGLTDDEVRGIIEIKDSSVERMVMAFLEDYQILNQIYRRLGGRYLADWTRFCLETYGDDHDE